MKILTGRFKDTTIPFKPQPGLRPTPDRVRKAVIDALQPWRGLRVLDLFSGTGALGLEALSAGADECLFVESDRRRAAQIQAALDRLGLGGECRVESDEVLAVLGRLARLSEGGGEDARGGDARDRASANENGFDRVLADPPYEKGFAQKTLEFFKEGSALRMGAWVVVETYKKETMPPSVGRLESRRVAFYGDTAIHYYVLV